MKTKTLIMACLLLGFGLTQLSAQNDKNGNGSNVFWHTWDTYYVFACNSSGEVTDMLVGPVTCHYVQYYKDGVFLWERARFTGEVVSVGLDGQSGTGEVFSLKDHWTTLEIGESGAGHFIAKGDQGTTYIIFYQFQWLPDPPYEIFTVLKAIKP
jgi:hypothetical protein